MDFDLLYKRLIPRLKLTAQKYRNYVSSLNEDDLYQEACFYLWDKYKNGVPAGINDTYIVIGCEFHIRNEIRKQRRRATFVSLDDPIEGTEFTLKDTIADPRDNFNQINRSVTINDILNNGFTKREKEVFAQLIDGYTVREIGVRLGISHVRVVKLKKNIIKRWLRKEKRLPRQIDSYLSN